MKTHKFHIVLLFVSVLLLSTQLVLGQAIMKSPVSIETPLQISELISENIWSTETVDFNGDGNLDYIVSIKRRLDEEPYTELWYSSSYKLIKKIPRYYVNIDFRWFVNLDADPEPEIITAEGYADGIDYSIYDQDIKEWIDKLLFRFNPVLIDSSNKMSKYYWGYPWDITNIVTKIENGIIKIHCSFDHDIVREGEIDIPKWQVSLPAIFFSGKTTQPDIGVADIRKEEWLSLENIEVNSKK